MRVGHARPGLGFFETALKKVGVFVEVAGKDCLVPFSFDVQLHFEMVNGNHGYGVPAGDNSTGINPSCTISSVSTATELCIAFSSGPTHLAASPA